MDDIPEELLNKYKSSIPAKMVTLQTLIEKAKSVPSLEITEEIKAFAHKMAGNSQMYGYKEASSLFRELEQFAKSQIEKSPNDFNWLKQCDEYFEKLIRVFR